MPPGPAPPTGADEVRTAKARLRTEVLQARAAVPEALRAAASAAVRRRLAALPEVAGARALLAYAAFGSEVDLDPLLADAAAAGRGVLLPYVDGDRLAVARVRDLDGDLAPGYRGIREPVLSGRRSARPDRVDVVLVPGVAFDGDGGRLGYGGGFYDELLGRVPARVPRIGVAFALQVVPRVPREAHDVRLDAVVTEAGVLRTGGGPGPRS